MKSKRKALESSLGGIGLKAPRKQRRSSLEIHVRVCKGGEIEGQMKSKRKALESSLGGMGLKAPRKQRRSSLEMQRTTADGYLLADGSLDLGENIFLQAVVRIAPDNQTSQIASSHSFLIFSCCSKVPPKNPKFSRNGINRRNRSWRIGDNPGEGVNGR